MFSVLVGVLGALALAWPAAAQVQPFPDDFRTQEITTDDGATIHLRASGHGPAVVLLHGFGDTGDMWAPLAAEPARDHTVVVPDLRGMGLSSHPADGYDKRTQAAGVRAVLTHLGLDRAVIVGYDLGTMVAYAYAGRYPEKTEQLVVMDAPVPGIPPGTTSCVTPCSGIAPSAARMRSGLSRDASASISTASGTSLQPTPRRSTRPRGSITRSSMCGRARCARPSPSSWPSRPMSKATKRRWRPG
jgi:pimeloyl-ACP methyl ester carboxylesterase